MIAIPKIDIQIQSGALGKFSDVGGGSPGIIVPIATAPVSHAMGDVKMYSSYEALPTELQVVSLDLFFKTAPNAPIYVMPVPTTANVKDIVNGTFATPYAKNLLNHSDVIRYIGIVGTMLEVDLATALTNAQALGTTLFAKLRPIITFIPYSYRSADVPDDISTGTHDRVGVLSSYNGDEIGLLLGIRAANSVQRNIGRVKSGALPISSCLLDGAANPPIDVEKGADVVLSLQQKGYITIRKHLRRTGLFFTDDPLACSGDFSTIANRSVIDKALLITYDTYVEEINDDEDIAEDGTLPAAVIKSLQSSIKTAISTGMAGEISGVSSYIDEKQNLISTSKIEIVVSVRPKGYKKIISIKLGLINPANQ